MARIFHRWCCVLNGTLRPSVPLIMMLNLITGLSCFFFALSKYPVSTRYQFLSLIAFSIHWFSFPATISLAGGHRIVFFFFSHLIPINDDVLSFRMVAPGRTNNKRPQLSLLWSKGICGFANSCLFFKCGRGQGWVVKGWGGGVGGFLFLKRSTLCTLEAVKDPHPSGSIPELNFF